MSRSVPTWRLLCRYVHACYGVMPEFAATFVQGLESQMDQCNGGAGSASTDLSAACDVASLANACARCVRSSTRSWVGVSSCLPASADPGSRLGPHRTNFAALGPALTDYNQRLQECQDAGLGGRDDPTTTDVDESLGNDFNCKNDVKSPQLETLCESDCLQQLLGSYDACSQVPAAQALLGTQCMDAKVRRCVEPLAAAILPQLLHTAAARHSPTASEDGAGRRLPGHPGRGQRRRRRHRRPAVHRPRRDGGGVRSAPGEAVCGQAESPAISS